MQMSKQNLHGKIIKSTGSHYLISYQDDVIEGRIRGKFRTANIDSTNPVAVGDNVIFSIQEDKTAIISEILERKNNIIRQSTNLSRKRHILASNIDQAILVVSLHKPTTPVEFIDRFLVSCEAYNITAKIIFNKIDIYTAGKEKQHDKLLNTYSKIGYECYSVSIIEKINTENLYELFKDKITVLSGNSGVGKTSLINYISPSYNLKIGEISSKHHTGKHTTTFAEMHKLDFGGYVIDSPGIKAYGLSFLDKKSIYHYFPEIFRVSANCKYNNCQHLNEPECAVKTAFLNGEIAETRFKSYLNIVQEDNNKYRTQLS